MSELINNILKKIKKEQLKNLTRLEEINKLTLQGLTLGLINEANRVSGKSQAYTDCVNIIETELLIYVNS